MKSDVLEKMEKCMVITEKALKNAKPLDDFGKIILKFAKDYFEDSKYYQAKSSEDPKHSITALEAVSYAHGLLDAGVLSGHISIKNYHLSKQEG
ncbi:MAG: DUF357 domain-containing protein [archaeon]